MDELDRLYRRLVQNIRAGFPELLTRGFEVSQLYQHIIPYRTNRRELGFDSNEEYELAVMQLLAGLRGYLLGDAEMQKAMRTELASPNPDLAAFRIFATSTVSLSAEALRALEKFAAGGELVSSASSLSPSEQAVLAGRATESVEATGESPMVGRGAPESAAPSAFAPAPPTASPTAAAASSSAAPPAARVVSAPPESPTLHHAPARPPLGANAAPAGASAAPLRRPTPLASSDAKMAAPRSTAPTPSSSGEGCRYCGGVLPDGRRVTFCPNCGHNLTVQHCPACSTELEVGWKFCITCGREVGKA
ncbi:MAG: zinc ribbon domain-containing protein [Gemmatimonadetes bacterium]|nr:zinc ribbon domain-containing protein [Gemmatimonadota bacterium]